MFRELRTRKGGADPKADVAMVGLGTGSAACYALPGQQLTFYEIDPAVKHLVADTDKYFTFVSDARKRGADVDIRHGRRPAQAEGADADRKYALLLVDAFSSDSIPVHLLTQGGGANCTWTGSPTTGSSALHISNKFVKLEPVVARIAEELGLIARRVERRQRSGAAGQDGVEWVVRWPRTGRPRSARSVCPRRSSERLDGTALRSEAQCSRRKAMPRGPTTTRTSCA